MAMLAYFVEILAKIFASDRSKDNFAQIEKHVEEQFSVTSVRKGVWILLLAFSSAVLLLVYFIVMVA